MLRRSGIITLSVVAAALLLSRASAADSKLSPNQQLIINLSEAFNGESNAHARYLAFAAQADNEGYTQVASLFRAAAKAEDIHANNHASVLKTLGVEAKADLVSPEVQSTKENLQAAIKGESYERDTMYPQFITQARAE